MEESDKGRNGGNHRKVMVCFNLGADMGCLLAFPRQNSPITDLGQTLVEFKSRESARDSDSVEIDSSSTCYLMELFFLFVVLSDER